MNLQAELDAILASLEQLEITIAPILSGLRMLRKLGENVNLNIIMFEGLLAAAATLRKSAQELPTTIENRDLITELRRNADALGHLFGTNGQAVGGSITIGDPVPM